jgi:hypothetical protein
VLAAVRGWLDGRENVRLADYLEARRRRPYGLPSVPTLYRWVGTWPEVLRACGRVGPVPGYRYWTPDQILDALAGWLVDNPAGFAADYDDQSSGNLDLPSSTTVLRNFGSWRAAIDAARHRDKPPGRVNSIAGRQDLGDRGRR